MEDKIVEIARFYEPEAAQMIESLLEIGRNQMLSEETNIRAGHVPSHMGGIRIELLESEVPMQWRFGSKRIRISERRRRSRTDSSRFRLDTSRSVPTDHLPLEKQIIVLFILVAVFLALVVYFGSLVSSN